MRLHPPLLLFTMLSSAVASSATASSSAVCSNEKDGAKGHLSHSSVVAESGKIVPSQKILFYRKWLEQEPSSPVSSQIKPWTIFGGRERWFSAAWYQSCQWLEYSVACDACFCFPCRVFSGAFDTFVTMGLRGWKAELERDRGLHKHVCGQVHLKAPSAWTEFRKMEFSAWPSATSKEFLLHKKHWQCC